MPSPPLRKKRRAPQQQRGAAPPIDSQILDGPLAFLGDPDAFLPRFVLSLALAPPPSLRRLRRR
ncbi:MAG TPA: hypothetical protein VFF06_24660 [Polyangia bacterium]|nr:hypothetical protein [Polyangia bacterium]